jgi:hypothetical protein
MNVVLDTGLLSRALVKTEINRREFLEYVRCYELVCRGFATFSLFVILHLGI